MVELKRGSGLSINSVFYLIVIHIPYQQLYQQHLVELKWEVVYQLILVFYLLMTSTDNLGDHTASQNIQLNDKWLSNDGNNAGIRIDNWKSWNRD